MHNLPARLVTCKRERSRAPSKFRRNTTHCAVLENAGNGITIEVRAARVRSNRRGETRVPSSPSFGCSVPSYRRAGSRERPQTREPSAEVVQVTPRSSHLVTNLSDDDDSLPDFLFSTLSARTTRTSMATASTQAMPSTLTTASDVPVSAAVTSTATTTAPAPAMGNTGLAAPRPFALSSSYSTTAGTGLGNSTTSNKMRASVDALSWRQNAGPHQQAAAAASAASKRGSSPGHIAGGGSQGLRPASEYLAASNYGPGQGQPHERGHSFGGTTTTTSASESESRSASDGLGQCSLGISADADSLLARVCVRPSSRRCVAQTLRAPPHDSRAESR